MVKSAIIFLIATLIVLIGGLTIAWYINNKLSDKTITNLFPLCWVEKKECIKYLDHGKSYLVVLTITLILFISTVILGLLASVGI